MIVGASITIGSQKVKIEAPTFDGIYDPQVSNEWLADMNHYFDWNHTDDEHRVKFAKMKLQGKAKIYWMSIERQCARQNRVPIDMWGL